MFHSGTGHTAGNMDDNIVCDCGIDRTLDETDLRRHDDVLRHHFGGRVGQRLHTASLKFRCDCHTVGVVGEWTPVSSGVTATLYK